MKVLVDLNVVLDVVQRREPHYQASAEILSRIAAGELEGAIAGHAITTIDYLVSRFAGRDRAKEAVDWLIRDFEIVPVGRELLLRARAIAMGDFEDAVVAAAAEASGCHRIVSRNVADFGASPVTALSPRELRAELAVREETGAAERNEGVDETGDHDSE